jgi:uncharacterized repeat protein (TIGR03803 family)
MPTAVANGSAYDVTVRVNPTALNCTVISGAGAANGANVTSVTVSCMPGAESVLYSFTGGALDGEKPLGTLFQASDGNFYGTTQFGGANSAGTFFKITPHRQRDRFVLLPGRHGTAPIPRVASSRPATVTSMA